MSAKRSGYFGQHVRVAHTCALLFFPSTSPLIKIGNRPMWTEAKQDDVADEAVLRQLVLPEEDRCQYTSAPWRGGFRWFRSPNVIPIERWRQLRLKQQATNPL
jgi:hypothetical protein